MAINMSDLSKLSEVNTTITPGNVNLMGSAMYNKYKGTNIGKEGLAGGDLMTQLSNFKSPNGAGAAGGGILTKLNGIGGGS
jgi:hypothetical protein